MRLPFRSFLLVTALGLSACGSYQEPLKEDARLTEAARLDINPGNAAVAPDGTIFATVHQFRRAPVQLIKMTGPDSYAPFPDNLWNDRTRPAGERFVSLLGIRTDATGRVWVIDNGNDEGATYPPKLLAFDGITGQLVYRHDFPTEVIRPGGFPQDFVLDSARGFAYVADAGMVSKPALVVVDLNNNKSWRLEGLKEFNYEDNDLKVEGREQTMMKEGKRQPAKIGLDPITISADGETVFFGAMNSEKWYGVPARLLREHAPADEIGNSIELVGRKPVSDGAITDDRGNHFFTDLNRHSIAMMPAAGGIAYDFVTDPRLRWPDGLNFGPDGALYVTVNQLHLSPVLNGGKDEGTPPYYILRFQP